MGRRAEQFWANFFGLDPEEWERPGVRVVAHRGLGEYPGAWIFWRGETVILSTPPELVAETRTALPSTLEALHEPERLAGLFAARTVRTIGPAYQGYLNPHRFRPAALAAVAPLTCHDGLLEELCAACDPEEWSHAGIEPERPEPCFGYRHDGRLVAVAQNEFWAEGVVSPGLIVHPAHRGCGYGKTVLAAAVADALRHDHLVLYQTLRSNTAAIGAAEALGFTQFASHLAVRFRT